MSNQYFTTLEDSAKQFSMLNTSNSNVADTLTTNNATITGTLNLNGALILPNIVTLTAAEIETTASKVLKVSESGKIFLLPNLSANSTITLPTPVDNAGVNFSFMFNGTENPMTTHTLTITSNTANIVGYVIDLTAGSAKSENAVPGSEFTQIDVKAFSSVNEAGDLQLYIYSDGLLYHLQGTVTEKSSGSDPIDFS